MSNKSKATPRFCKDQIVWFVGGTGRVKSYQPDADSWFYSVEMEMGPEPDMGRIGFETTILLHETDITGVMN